MSQAEIMQASLEPIITYARLTSEIVNRLSPQEAEVAVIRLLAERARVRGEGKILSWSEFNENPDPLINRLLARILLSQLDPKIFRRKQAKEIAVLSIENSAVYLANQITHELEKQYGLDRPPRLIRARKSYTLSPPSPAMGEYFAVTTVFPITASGEPRHLVASMPDKEDLEHVRILIVVDDFRATGNSLRGGIELGLDLLGQAGVPMNEVTVIPMAGLGKPEQEEERRFSDSGARIVDVMTAVDVHFWGDETTGHAHIQANGSPPLQMSNARATDFSR